MSDNSDSGDSSDSSMESKLTTVEEGTEFKGTLHSKCAVLVRGSIDGDITVPALTVTESGVVVGRVRARELRSAGVLEGSMSAEAMYISGAIRDNTVITARSLEVNPKRRTDPLYVVLGNCVLEVGDEPALKIVAPEERVGEVQPLGAEAPADAPADGPADGPVTLTGERDLLAALQGEPDAGSVPEPKQSSVVEVVAAVEVAASAPVAVLEL